MTSMSGRWGAWLRVLALSVICLAFAYLMTALVLLGFRTQDDVRAGGILSGASLTNLAYNWQQVSGFVGGIFATWMTNSLIVSLSAAAIASSSALAAGYALARLRFVGRRSLLFITLLTMVVPNTVLVIPIFLSVASLGLVGKTLPVIVVMAFYPFGVYLAFIHYSTALPKELLEAARIDGCSEVGTFWHIALPISRQPFALAFFFAFVADWTNYFLPLVLLPLSQNTTVPVGLQQMISQSQLYDPTAAAGLDVQLYLPQLGLAATVQMVPVLIVFVAVQRYLVRGVTVGAVKA